ncbi:MAG TPA: nuclease-related domain-containing protein [Actinopolymorphaceae bacterium]
MGSRKLTPLLRFGIAVVGLFLLLVAALQGDAATTLVVGVLVAVAFVAWWRRNRTAAGSAASLAVTLVWTSSATEWAARHNPLISPVQQGLVFWLFAVVVVGVVWLMPGRHSTRAPSRAVTVALGHAALCLASPLVVLSPVAAPVLGLSVAMLLVWWRSRRRVAGEDVPDEQRRVAAIHRGEQKTSEALTHALADPRFSDWRVLSHRQLRGRGGRTHRLEHVVLGPGGVYVVETRDWAGAVSLVDVAGGSESRSVNGPARAYALDGDPHELASRLLPSVRRVRDVAEALGVSADAAFGLVVFWGDTRLPEDSVSLALVDESARSVTPTTVTLLRGHRLADWLVAQPSRIDPRHVARLSTRMKQVTLSMG